MQEVLQEILAGMKRLEEGQKHLLERQAKLEQNQQQLWQSQMELLERQERLELRMDKLEERQERVETQMGIMQSNQVIFLQELREFRLENQTRDRLIMNEFREVHEKLRHVNYRVADLEIDAFVWRTVYGFATFESAASAQ